MEKRSIFKGGWVEKIRHLMTAILSSSNPSDCAARSQPVVSVNQSRRGCKMHADFFVCLHPKSFHKRGIDRGQREEENKETALTLSCCAAGLSNILTIRKKIGS